MTAIASRNPFDLLSDDGEPSSGAMTVAPVKKKGAASLAAPASDISSKTSAAAAQINKGPRNNNNNNNRTKDGSQHSNYNSSSQSSRDNKGGENRNRSARPDGTSLIFMPKTKETKRLLLLFDNAYLFIGIEITDICCPFFFSFFR